MVDTEPADSGIAFLLEEYRQLHEQRRSIMTSAHNQVSIFFAAASASGVALGFLLKDDAEFTPSLATFVAVVSLVLLAAGISTLWRLTHFHANSVRYARGLNRIRGFMVDRYSYIQPALSLPTDDTHPEYLRDTKYLLKFIPNGRTGIVVVVNAALSGTATYTALLALDADPGFALVIGAGVAAVVVGCLHKLEIHWITSAARDHNESLERSITHTVPPNVTDEE